jgi:hypothetical protein
MPSPAGGTSQKRPRYLRHRRQEHYPTNQVFDTNACAGSLGLSNSAVDTRIRLRAGIAICCVGGESNKFETCNSLPPALSK